MGAQKDAPEKSKKNLRLSWLLLKRNFKKLFKFFLLIITPTANLERRLLFFKLFSWQNYEMVSEV